MERVIKLEDSFAFKFSMSMKAEAERLYEEAKRCAVEEDNYALAIEKLLAAVEIFPLPKYKHRLEKLLAFVESEEKAANPPKMSSNGPKENVQLRSGLSIRKVLYDKLYSYQAVGIDWMYGLYLKNKGGILADDMGLGKTFQSIALISSLLDSHEIKSALIVAPVTLLINWQKEFMKWAPSIIVAKFDGAPGSRMKTLRSIQSRGGVLLITYGLCRNYSRELSTFGDENFMWDYLILDEGHKIKNATKTTKSIYEISCKNRLLLTGTPVQNNLREMWVLFDFVMSGSLLGTYRTFKDNFETPILNGREKNASDRARLLSCKTAERLREICQPYLLRRTKNEVLKDMQRLPRKYDWVVWIYLNQSQIDIYNKFLNLDSIKQLILGANANTGFLHLLTLKKICDHLRLLPQRVCNELLQRRNGNISENVLNGEDVSIIGLTDEELIGESRKLSFCLDLLETLRREGHKTLLFSQSTKMLDIIQQILVHRNWKISRLDGRVVKMKTRDAIVHTFENDADIPVCLLSSQVGGVGLTLTSANRVIIYDPCWNPATDSQAIDRAYRIGQQREVIVYRLITCGTVEEQIYRRQIYKNSITKQTVEEESDPTRYFSREDLRQLFKFTDPTVSETYQLITDIHGSDVNCTGLVASHLQTLRGFNQVFNIHDHSKLFSVEEPECLESAEVIDLINIEVRSAFENLNKDSEQAKQIREKSGAKTHTFQLPVNSAKKNNKKVDHYVAPVNPSVIEPHRDSDYNQLLDSFHNIQIDFEEAPNKSNGNSSVIDLESSSHQDASMILNETGDSLILGEQPDSVNESLKQIDDSILEILSDVDVEQHVPETVENEFDFEILETTASSSASLDKLMFSESEEVPDASDDITKDKTELNGDDHIANTSDVENNYDSESEITDEESQYSDENNDSLREIPNILRR